MRDNTCRGGTVVHLTPWQRDGSGHSPAFRRFTEHTATVRPQRGKPVVIRLDGEEFADGSEQRMIAVEESDGLGALTATDARQLAAALLEAAERLDGDHYPVAHNAPELRDALAAYNRCDDDASHERAAAQLAIAVTRLLNGHQ